MGFFIPVKFHLFIISAVFFWGCQPKTTEDEEKIPPFNSFKNYPKNYFLDLNFNKANKDYVALCNKLQGTLLHFDYNYHFFLTGDSTEIIFPNEAQPNWCKIYLKSKKYLNNPSRIKDYLKKSADIIQEHPILPIYIYKKDSIAYKLSFFEQETYLRLKFTKL